jgi:hypothetical protein
MPNHIPHQKTIAHGSPMAGVTVRLNCRYVMPWSLCSHLRCRATACLRFSRMSFHLPPLSVVRQLVVQAYTTIALLVRVDVPALTQGVSLVTHLCTVPCLPVQPPCCPGSLPPPLHPPPCCLAVPVEVRPDVLDRLVRVTLRTLYHGASSLVYLA